MLLLNVDSGDNGLAPNSSPVLSTKRPLYCFYKSHLNANYNDRFYVMVIETRKHVVYQSRP